MRAYLSHKRVAAAKIVAFNQQFITIEGGATVAAPEQIYDRYTPLPGDWLVRSADGYLSISPRAAFEEGYKALDSLSEGSSLQATDQESAAVATAPRIALAAMEAKIAARYDLTGQDAIRGAPAMAALKLLSLCILVMNNGFMVVGKSAPASPRNFNAALGRKFAYEDAVRQLWPLEGYALREKLHIPPTEET